MTLVSKSKPARVPRGQQHRGYERLHRHTQAVREHWHEIVWMKDALAREDALAFLEVWMDLGETKEARHAIQVALWSVSTRAGGIWTTAERALIRLYESELQKRQGFLSR